jgi:transposase
VKESIKFYKFKQKFLNKAKLTGKIVFLTNESYTTKTSSFCGVMNDIGSSKIYKCKSCKKCVDRDETSAKNILMKGIVTFG